MAKLFLQNLDSYNQILELDPLSFKKTYFDRDPNIAYNIQGHFAQVQDQLVLFYRDNSVLHFESNGINLPLSDQVQATLESSKTQNQLIFAENNKEILRFSYDPRLLSQPIKGDSTGFIELEQFDICIFVNNVLNDENRRGRIYTDSAA